jgi:DNA-binding XRE family transcriptional regulator
MRHLRWASPQEATLYTLGAPQGATLNQLWKDKNMSSVRGNQLVAKRRGNAWRENLSAGKHEARTKPSRLREYRLSARLTQDEVAAAVHLTLSTYGAVERGIRPVTAHEAQIIAKTIGAPLKDLFSKVKGTEKMLAVKVKVQ